MTARARKERLLRLLTLAPRLLVFWLALWALHSALQQYHYRDITRELTVIPRFNIFLSLALTFLGYAATTGYDVLALRYIRHRVPLPKSALASFASYAIGNNAGFGNLATSSIRYHLYSAWAVPAVEISKIIVFCTLGFWAGFFALGAVVLLAQPVVLPASFPLPFHKMQPLGFLFAGLLAAYFIWSGTRRHPLSFRGVEFFPPRGKLFLSQVLLASVDWALAGSALYTLLPSAIQLRWGEFIGIYLLINLVALVSHVPGGLGVLESLMVLFLASGSVPASAVLGAVLAYRAIYYLLPLFIGSALLASYEAVRNRRAVAKASRTAAAGVSALVPIFLALTTFVGGTILLASGATPPAEGRMDLINRIIPLPVVEISHFLGSVVGASMLLLAWALYRRLDGAFVLTAIVCCVGAVFSLLKGFDYEEAVVLLITLAALLPCKRQFYRRSALLGEPFSAGWSFAILAVLITSAWLGNFSYKHVEYSHDLWWQFAIENNAPRFLRATAGAVGLALLVALARIIRPLKRTSTVPSQADLQRAREIVALAPHASASLALLNDKHLIFSQARNAFIMFGVQGKSWVALGDPVGPEEEWPGLAWRFRQLCDRYCARTVFYQIRRTHLDLYLDLGLTFFKVGEEGRVILETFSLQGRERKDLRRTQRHLQNEGYGIRVLPREQVPALLPELKRISDSWLRDKNTREKRFSLGFFSEAYLSQFPCVVVEKDKLVVAFANLLQTAGKQELSVDLMRYSPNAPRSVMDYLFTQLMLWGREHGYQFFNLGIAPFSGLENQPFGSTWSRFGAFVFNHGEHFYNFRGLRSYKDKFDPVWEPMYLACPSGWGVARVLTDIASLISGGLKGIVAK